ncbi:transporter substrate-binding domain-containing protein [Chromobacterium sp. IIBBL 290-4]|uniref:transporter substrate-binding domain-containing protein n=1 Tax=Chromobacterium sp. IIBBL 290-4 TaxID=2953890 RepID=UPI0020B7F9E5|nr:transporter substrate-binding domain-containing protein [Chromobacterium sp. IIBBL 290-4]UTH74663.1 transporter substrate-binding domain-containing protein [Chromobacterium sp. IIBBL 290-4]
MTIALSGVLAPASARSLKEVLQSRQLRVCIVPVNSASVIVKPKDCREQCEFSGPVYEEVQAFVRNLGPGIRLKSIRIEWDEQFYDKTGRTDIEGSYTPQLLASGACDIYPSRITKNAWRLKKMDFVTLFPNRMMVVANVSRKAQLKSPADLAGLSAAVDRNTSYHSWLLEQNHGPYAAKPVKITVLKTEDSLRAVDGGKVDFTILDSDIAIWDTRYLLKHTYVAFPIGAMDEIGWAFRKDDKDLQAAAARFFAQQKQDERSELNQIWVRHHGLSLNRFITLVNSTQ